MERRRQGEVATRRCRWNRGFCMTSAGRPLPTSQRSRSRRTLCNGWPTIRRGRYLGRRRDLQSVLLHGGDAGRARGGGKRESRGCLSLVQPPRPLRFHRARCGNLVVAPSWQAGYTKRPILTPGADAPRIVPVDDATMPRSCLFRRVMSFPVIAISASFWLIGCGASSLYLSYSRHWRP